MSIWEKYEKDYRAAYVTPLTKGEFIGDRLETFVGTLVQIKAEEARLTDKYVEYKRAVMEEYNDKVEVIFTAYNMELRADNKHAPPQIFDIAYGMAYDHGHSAGYGEVENYLGDFLDRLMDAYQLGIEEGRSQK